MVITIVNSMKILRNTQLKVLRKYDLEIPTGPPVFPRIISNEIFSLSKHFFQMQENSKYLGESKRKEHFKMSMTCCRSLALQKNWGNNENKWSNFGGHAPWQLLRQIGGK